MGQSTEISNISASENSHLKGSFVNKFQFEFLDIQYGMM